MDKGRGSSVNFEKKPNVKTKVGFMAKEVVKHRKEQKKKSTLTSKERKAKKQEKKQKKSSS